MISLGELRGILSLEDTFTPKLKLAMNQLESQADKMQSVGSKLTTAGTAITAALTLPLAAAAAQAIKTSADFDRSLNAIDGVLQTTDAQMEAVRQRAIQLGADTAFSAKDAADAMLELGKAGFEVEEAIEGTAAVMELAAASGLSMADSASLASRTMAAFGLEVADLGHINDVLAKSVNSTTLEIHDLQIALPYVSAIATGFGRSMEEVSAALGVMRDQGIAAETTGRALREMFAKLSNPVKGTIEVFEELGISMEEVDPTMHSIAEIVGVLQTKGLTAAQSLKAFGDAAGPGLYALTRQGEEGLRKLTKELEESEGSAKEMAESMMQGLPGAMERLKGSVETAWIAIGRAITPTVIKVMDMLGALADFITNYLVPAWEMLPGPVQGTVLILGAVAAAIGPIIGLAGLLLTSLGSIGAAFGAAGTAAGGASVVIGALGTALGLIPAAIAVIGTAWAAFNIASWVGEITGVTDAFGSLIITVGEFVGILPKGTAEADKLGQSLEGQLPTVKGLAEAKAAWIPKLDFAAKAQANLTAQMLKGTDAASDYMIKLRAERQEFENLTPKVKAQIRAALELDGTVGEIAEAFGVAESAVRRYKEQLDEATKSEEAAKKAMDERLESMRAQAVEQNNAINKQITANAQLGVGTNSLAEWFNKLNLVQTRTLQQQGELEAKAKEWAITNGAVLAPSIKGIGKELEELDLEKQAARWAKIGKIGQNVANSIIQAIQGGGNVGKAAGSQLGLDLGNWAGEALGKKLGGSLGGIVGSALGPLGSMVGGWLGGKVGGLFSKLFGGDKEKKQVEQMRNEVIRTAGGMDALKEKAAKAGVSLDALFKTKKVEDFKNALAQVDAGLNQHAERMNLAKQAAEEFGIPMERMGEAFKQAETDAAGFDLLDKVTALMESGVDMGTLVEYAGDDVAKFIQRAMEMGTTVPLEFKKIAEAMAAEGKLRIGSEEEMAKLIQRKTDLEKEYAEAVKDSSAEGLEKQAQLKEELNDVNKEIDTTGKSFDNLDEIPWAENMNTMFTNLMEKLGDFIDMVGNGLGGALDRLPKNIDIKFNGQYEGDLPNPEGSTNMATGGLVTSRTPIIAGEAGPEAIIPMNKLDNFFGDSDGPNTTELLNEMRGMNRNIVRMMTQMPSLAARMTVDAARGAAI